MNTGGSLYLSSMEAKKYIPSTARVEFSPTDFNIYRIAARYMLYPLELSERWQYFIDFDHSVINPPSDWNVYLLSTGVRIFVKPGYDILQEPNLVNPYFGFKVMVTFMIVVAINMAMGWLLLRFFPLGKWSELRLSFLGTGYVALFIALAVVLWLFLLWGGTLEQNALIILWVMTSLILLLVFKGEQVEK
ncbi:MAG: hypothetical protein NUV91_01995 [Candidatus Omnitrophica bacterium]|nr:hypothetical protein [Candidatus Omnitrophota bacterium]